jgi:hypothetical protein
MQEQFRRMRMSEDTKQDKKQGGGSGAEKAPKVQPGSAQDDLGRLNPSSPAETGTTPGSNGQALDGQTTDDK